MVTTPDWYNVVTYGADPTGSADSTAAINSAVAAASNTYGGVIYFAAGSYKVSSTISTSKPSIIFRGDGINSSIIVTNSATLDVIDLSGFGSGVMDLFIQSSVTRTGGYYVSLSGSDQQISNFQMNGAYGGVSLTGSNQWVTQGIIGNCAAGGRGIFINTGSAPIRIDTVVMTALVGATPNSGIFIAGTGDCKISNCDIIAMGTDLNVSPGNGASVYSLWVHSCNFDNGGHAASGVNGIVIGPTSNGNVERAHFIGCWTADHTNQGFLIENTGTGTVSGIQIIGHESYGNAVNGLEILTGVTGVNIDGGIFSGNTGSGIVIGNSVTDFSITGVQSGSYGWTSSNTGYGIAIGTGCDHYVCANNRMKSNGAGTISNGSSTSSNNYVGGNVGY